MQLKAITSHAVTSYLGKEVMPDLHLDITSFQVAVKSDKVSPEPSLLQSEPSQSLTSHSFGALLWTHSRVSVSCGEGPTTAHSTQGVSPRLFVYANASICR